MEITFFPFREPYKADFLRVSPFHRIYWEESGNKNGFPIVFVHGGPGYLAEPEDRQFFSPNWRTVLFHQRGCGNSKPLGELRENETKHLIEDIKKLFERLRIRKAVLFGGSWGSFLSLAFAIKYPEHVAGLILRAVMLGETTEADHYVRGGIRNHFPDVWEMFVNAVPEKHRKPDISVEGYYHKVLAGPDFPNSTEALGLALTWAAYEESLAHLKNISIDEAERLAAVYDYMTLARIESHYYHRNFFYPESIIHNCQRIAEVPVVMVQGRYDAICPPSYAYRLHKALPHSKLIITQAGHSSMEPETTRTLIAETEAMRMLVTK